MRMSNNRKMADLERKLKIAQDRIDADDIVADGMSVE